MITPNKHALKMRKDRDADKQPKKMRKTSRALRALVYQEDDDDAEHGDNMLAQFASARDSPTRTYLLDLGQQQADEKKDPNDSIQKVFSGIKCNPNKQLTVYVNVECDDDEDARAVKNDLQTKLPSAYLGEPVVGEVNDQIVHFACKVTAINAISAVDAFTYFGNKVHEEKHVDENAKDAQIEQLAIAGMLYGVTSTVVKNSDMAANAYTSIIRDEGLSRLESVKALEYSKEIPGRMFWRQNPEEKEAQIFYRKYHCKTYADVLAHFKMFRDAGVHVRVLPHNAPHSTTTTDKTTGGGAAPCSWGAFGAPPGMKLP